MHAHLAHHLQLLLVHQVSDLLAVTDGVADGQRLLKHLGRPGALLLI